MLTQDVTEPSDSDWNFPLILVPKPDGTFRPVVDYRKLNEKDIPDRLPLPVNIRYPSQPRDIKTNISVP